MSMGEKWCVCGEIIRPGHDGSNCIKSPTGIIVKGIPISKLCPICGRGDGDVPHNCSEKGQGDIIDNQRLREQAEKEIFDEIKCDKGYKFGQWMRLVDERTKVIELQAKVKELEEELQKIDELAKRLGKENYERGAKIISLVDELKQLKRDAEIPYKLTDGEIDDLWNLNKRD